MNLRVGKWFKSGRAQDICQDSIFGAKRRDGLGKYVQAGNFDWGVVERKEICEGELGVRHGGLGVGMVVCFSICSAFVRGLKLGGQWPVVRMDVSIML